MDAALEFALDADAPLVFWAIEIIGDGVTLRLLDGSGVVSFGGATYRGADATYGTWEPPNEFGDGISSDAPTISCTIRPPSDSAAFALLEAMPQRSPVRVHFGAVDRTTGAVIGTDLRFDGEIDVAVLAVGRNSIGIGLDVVSIWERFFDLDEGLGLTDAAWASIYPGEKAFQYVSALQRQLPWGSDGPRSAVIVDAPSGPGGANGAPNPYVGNDIGGTHGLIGALLR